MVEVKCKVMYDYDDKTINVKGKSLLDCLLQLCAKIDGYDNNYGATYTEYVLWEILDDNVTPIDNNDVDYFLKLLQSQKIGNGAYVKYLEDITNKIKYIG